MSENINKNHPDYKLIKKIGDLEQQIKDLKNNQIAVLVIPILAADPASPINGQVWYRSDIDVFKKRQAGVTKNWETA